MRAGFGGACCVFVFVDKSFQVLSVKQVSEVHKYVLTAPPTFAGFCSENTIAQFNNNNNNKKIANIVHTTRTTRRTLTNGEGCLKVAAVVAAVVVVACSDATDAVALGSGALLFAECASGDGDDAPPTAADPAAFCCSLRFDIRRVWSNHGCAVLFTVDNDGAETPLACRVC